MQLCTSTRTNVKLVDVFLLNFLRVRRKSFISLAIIAISKYVEDF